MRSEFFYEIQHAREKYLDELSKLKDKELDGHENDKSLQNKSIEPLSSNHNYCIHEDFEQRGCIPSLNIFAKLIKAIYIAFLSAKYNHNE
ncbi:MAG TPA: hypothetical protein PK028_00700 [Bacteroidales bacterium]|jgi:hypothetical protein|nr:hypothetical protein [Bacteroidales bacterium]MDI9573680.1 hypothetical protein [Bacteroidota bacterium]OQC62046.1 MAG: hypothetical protein BWX51_00193 [Bacteroidetes bacterium ADurb.Bin012]MBP9511915.1 hypothetical protein [Bacteroidales bacterium]MBP9588285.1 hypothetical protein [Bacteroidales bacterium]